MALVSDAQIGALRKVAYRGLVSKATVLRSVQVETDFGSDGQWATSEIDLPCWVREMSLQTSVIDVAMRETIVMIFRINFKVGTDVQPADRLVIDDLLFDVIDDNAENSILIYHTVTARRVQ